MDYISLLGNDLRCHLFLFLTDWCNTLPLVCKAWHVTCKNMNGRERLSEWKVRAIKRRCLRRNGFYSLVPLMKEVETSHERTAHEKSAMEGTTNTQILPDISDRAAFYPKRVVIRAEIADSILKDILPHVYCLKMEKRQVVDLQQAIHLKDLRLHGRSSVVPQLLHQALSISTLTSLECMYKHLCNFKGIFPNVRKLRLRGDLTEPILDSQTIGACFPKAISFELSYLAITPVSPFQNVHRLRLHFCTYGNSIPKGWGRKIECFSGSPNNIQIPSLCPDTLTWLSIQETMWHRLASVVWTSLISLTLQCFTFSLSKLPVVTPCLSSLRLTIERMSENQCLFGITQPMPFLRKITFDKCGHIDFTLYCKRHLRRLFPKLALLQHVKPWDLQYDDTWAPVFVFNHEVLQVS
jgi:hypothetical protein